MLRVAVLVALASGLVAMPLASARADTSIVTKNFTVASSLDGTTLEARYYRPAGGGPYPVVLDAHGGGGSVDSDAPNAQRYAREGFVGVVWSARGHGNSGGFFDFFGPKTVQDTRDVLTWVLDHRAETGADAAHVGITGYSQGGGTTNLAAAFDHRFTAIAPGHTFSGLDESLEPNGCTKLSIDAAIFAAAYNASLVTNHTKTLSDMTLITPWSAFLATGVGRDQTLRDWAIRSPRTYADDITQPSLWVQAFDDPLFPVDQALLMQRLEHNPANRLWLSWGGHFTNGTTPPEQSARDDAWHAWMAHWLRGDRNGIDRLPNVTWWYRAADGKTLVRRASETWPPHGTRMRPVAVPAGTILNAGGGQGVGDDAGTRYVGGLIGIGDAVRQLPNHTPADTLVASTPPLAHTAIYAGSARADIRWTNTNPDGQLDVKVWDVAPSGSATLLSRGCTALSGTSGGTALALWHSAIQVPAGHRLETWVQAADAPMWKPPPPNALTITPGSTVFVPLLSR